jgi:hypothetical protein
MNRKEFENGMEFKYANMCYPCKYQPVKYVKEGDIVEEGGYIVEVVYNRDNFICSVYEIDDSGFSFFCNILNEKVSGYIKFEELTKLT